MFFYKVCEISSSTFVHIKSVIKTQLFHYKLVAEPPPLYGRVEEGGGVIKRSAKSHVAPSRSKKAGLIKQLRLTNNGR